MSSIRASTVSSQPAKRKRPRTLVEGRCNASLTGDNDPKLQDSDKDLQAANELKAHRPQKHLRCVDRAPADWPESFQELWRVHRALTLVYTFCCTRKHLATTFDNIKTAVSNHLGRTLDIKDVAKVKTLVPEAINFEFVEEAALHVAILGEGFKDTKSLAHDPSTVDSNRDYKEKELLLFEFIDGDLSRQVVHARTGEPTRPYRKLREEELKMPVYSQKQMLNLIEKRVKKFTAAAEGYLKQCDVNKLDPCLALDSTYTNHLPKSIKKSEDDITQVQSRTNAEIPKDRDSINEIIEDIKLSSWYTGQIVPDGHRVFEPQPAIFGQLTFGLSQNLVNALYNGRKITQLYSHQADAINHLAQGKNVIVATSTSSGKSLIYQLPMLHSLEKNPQTRGIYIFPTKALAQDQKRSMAELLRLVPSLESILADTFDGDTPMSDRASIRDEARIIFTNPDMLHLTILPQEEKWRMFLKNLKFVVVDELHVYNGLFGSHVAFIMRRLRRICAAIGNRHVQFISCSATIANPKVHMQTIFGVEQVAVIEYDGSPSGRKEFICWNTPYKDPRDPSSGRGDTMAETARLFCQLIMRGIRVIAFCRVRKQCEVLITAFRNEAVSLERLDLIPRIMGYRGGYSPHDRRTIEKEMFEGKLMGIIATNALELGVDIGSLDAVISVGFPYTIANLRQQSGRAGRRNKDSLSILVGDCFATDQYYMSNPDEIFTRPNCELQVDLTNMLVLEGHLQCAAYEMPLKPKDDQLYFGSELPTIARDRMLEDSAGFFHCNERFRPVPSRRVAIRDTEDGHFAIIDMTNGSAIVLEEVEPSRAFFTIYEGGIFLHQGYKYLVKEFNTEKRYAKVTRVNVEWTTQQRDFTDVDPIETEAIRKIPNSKSRAFYGAIKIRAVVFGFFKIDRKRRILDAVEVDNPPIDIFSKGESATSALKLLNASHWVKGCGLMFRKMLWIFSTAVDSISQRQYMPLNMQYSVLCLNLS